MILSGRFKRETGEKFYCQPMAFESKSGIKLRVWTERALAAYENFGIFSGSIFKTTKQGKTKRAKVGDLDIKFH